MPSDLEQKYMELQYMQQQIEQMNQHLQGLMQQSMDVDISINALVELQRTPLDTDILSPIADGIFIRSKLQDSKNLIISVGSEVTVEKSVPEVAALLELQKREVKESIAEAESVMQQLTHEAGRMYQVLKDMEK